jgi:hypothetical protein
MVAAGELGRDQILQRVEANGAGRVVRLCEQNLRQPANLALLAIVIDRIHRTSSSPPVFYAKTDAGVVTFP